jgi:hypothetical protein
MIRSTFTAALRLAALGLAIAAVGAPSAGAGTTTLDFGVTLTGPAKAKVGEEVTYTAVVSNAGPGAESPKMRLAGGSGAVDTSTGEPLKIVSITPTQGTCKADGFGATCRLASIAPGASATVVVVAQALGRDLPALDVQATLEPEKASVVDSDAANNHVELVTPMPTPIKITGVPKNCTSKAFTVRVRTTVSGAKSTKVIIDNHTFGSTPKNRLKVKVGPDDLDPGSHTLSVVVQAGAGPPLTKDSVKFKTCAT